IVAALVQNNIDTRTAALKAIAALKLKAAIPATIRAAQNPQLRPHAVIALAEIPDARSADIFLSALGEKRLDLRVAARKGLVAIQNDAWTLIEPQLKTLPEQTIAELQRIYRGDKRAEAAGLNTIPINRPSPETYFEFALKNNGDAERGEKIFKDRNG